MYVVMCAYTLSEHSGSVAKVTSMLPDNAYSLHCCTQCCKPGPSHLLGLHPNKKPHLVLAHIITLTVTQGCLYKVGCNSNAKTVTYTETLGCVFGLQIFEECDTQGHLAAEAYF